MTMARNGTRPFWLHQLVEYILGVTLVSQALQSPTPAVPALAGGAMLVNAAVARGPLAAFRLVGRRTHRVLDVGVMVLTGVLALQPWAEVDPGARVIMLGILAVHAFVWWQSDLSEPAPRRGRPSGSARAPSAAPAAGTPATGTLAAGTPAAPPGTGPNDRSTEVGRAAGRAVGAGVRAVKRWTRS